MVTNRKVRYLSVAETAKLVRAAMKKEFPNVKFSVRSRSYSGGASIDVGWTDGPRTCIVEPIAKRYKGGGFDGMIDLKYSLDHYLRPDGETFVLHDPGTEGSGGMHSAEDNRGLAPLMPPDVELVQFGADFIFCQRSVSNFEAKVVDAVKWLYQHCHVIGDSRNPKTDMFGNRTVEDYARNMAWDWVEGEDWEANFKRR